jgi:hopene-associated glycosyltransferase HpnB
MVTVLTILAGLALAGWLYLILGRRWFWLAREMLPKEVPALAAWPEIVAVVPARDEADVIEEAVSSLLGQDYPGRLSVVLVDDGSRDGTAGAAERAAAASGHAGRLRIVEARPPEPGWTGKMWAVAEGLAAADDSAPGAAFVWLTDADIAHAPGELRALAGKALGDGRDLVSLMVLLNCRSAIERLLIPAFVFFFQKLYPFPAVNDPASRVAAAAGGSMLVRREALERAGGIAAIRGELIDDCALARRIKRDGPIWLGLTGESRSLRPYDGLGGIWRMVARTAFTQLGHSPAMLGAAVAGMMLFYVVPAAALVLGAVGREPAAAAMGGLALLLMGLAYRPTCRLYGPLGWPFLALPAAAFLYTLMTVDSARRHWRGEGGAWKGRRFARPPSTA